MKHILTTIICLMATSPLWADSVECTAVIDKTNASRTASGLGRLTENPQLTKAAQAHAEDMAQKGYFDHVSKEGRTPAQRAGAAGYVRSAAIGENIALGQKNATEVVAGWMKSKGHRENILNPVYSEIGVGMAEKAGKRYWVQVFATPAKGSPGKPTKASVVPSKPDLSPKVLDTLPEVPPLAPLPERQLLDGFESGLYFRWRLTGDCWANAPEGASRTGKYTGWSGSYYASSAHPRVGDFRVMSGKGIARSPEFPITHMQLRFKIGGGNYPDACALNLVVKDEEGIERIVRTQTGNDSDSLTEASWDLSDLVGKRARLEIIDKLAFGSHAYILVDDLELSGRPPDLGVALAPEPIRTGPVMVVEGKLPRPTAPKPATSVTSATLGSIASQEIKLPDGNVVRGKNLVLEATGYGPGENGPWGDRTALGTKVGYGTVAVDPKVIPLRSRLWVEGYGFCVALDTGSAIKGMKIDLGYNDDVTANQYGRKKIKVIVLD